MSINAQQMKQWALELPLSYMEVERTLKMLEPFTDNDMQLEQLCEFVLRVKSYAYARFDEDFCKALGVIRCYSKK